MKNENFSATIETDALISAAWDDARRNAEIERAAIIGGFFKRLFTRKHAQRAAPVRHGRLHRRMPAAVAVGGLD